MSGRSFLDTNIVVYAADASHVERAKHLTAVGLLTREPDRLVLSTQVLQEFYTVVTRRIARPLDQVRTAPAVRSLCKLEIVRCSRGLSLFGQGSGSCSFAAAARLGNHLCSPPRRGPQCCAGRTIPGHIPGAAS